MDNLVSIYHGGTVEKDHYGYPAPDFESEARELEEERKLRMTLEHHLTEQQKQLEGLDNTSILADQFTDSIQLDALKTPDSKYMPDGFVACRSRYSNDVEFSPIRENVDNTADEDLWTRLNKGCVTDLDMLEMTPGLKRETSLRRDATSAGSLCNSQHKQQCLSGRVYLFTLLFRPTDARCQKLEKDCISDPQQLDESNARCEALEKECDLLRDKNSSLQQELSESMREADRLVAEKQVELEDSKARCALLERELSKSRQDAERLATEKQELAGELGVERQKMEELKQDIRVISRAFSQREGQLTSLYTKSKAILENCKASHVATLP
uniref:Uncharacterized protein n=1 Tax=Setaria viridis TaxID=4556 RepID=A0A4V6Y7Y3_SETVI|nr:hypothetical protein SEVIR_8G156400v2 [Setaria viridis]